MEKEENKNCLFQYATRQRVIADTDLITEKEAQELWGKYQDDIKENWDVVSSPQMCIWIDCKNNTDYHTIGKEIDFRDCELDRGRFYKTTKTLIN